MSTSETRRDPLEPNSGTGGILPEKNDCSGCRFTLQCYSGKLQLDCDLVTYLCVSCGDFVVSKIPSLKEMYGVHVRVGATHESGMGMKGKVLDKFKCHMRPATADVISQWRQRAWGQLRYATTHSLYASTHIIFDPGPPQHGAPNLTLKLCDGCCTYWQVNNERRRAASQDRSGDGV